MATKVSSIVSAALRKLRIIDADGIPSPSEMRHGVDALNRMMARWEADGTALGFLPVVESTDDLHAPIEAENAIIFNLAVTLADEFGVTPGSMLAPLAASYKDALSRDMLNAAPLRARSRFPIGEGVAGTYDVYTDGYR